MGRHIDVGSRSCGRLLELGTRDRNAAPPWPKDTCTDATAVPERPVARIAKTNSNRPSKRSRPRRRRTIELLSRNAALFRFTLSLPSDSQTVPVRCKTPRTGIASLQRNDTGQNYRANKICGGGGLFAVRPFGHSKIRLAWSRSQRIVSRCLCA